MRKLLRRFSYTLLVTCALLLGVAMGVYYHNEIMVYVWAITGHAPAPLETSTPPPVSDATSRLRLPGLEAPLPLVYSETLEESQIQEYLKQGAVVLPLGTAFGDPGNVVVTAHSSGTEAFGPYRFAFAKLSELETGQEYEIVTPQAIYTYRVYAKEVVWPHEVDRLPNDDRSTVTLVTCWPLWTNFKRLLVHTELVNIEYQV